MGKTKGWTRDDWYTDGEAQLHFFPGPKTLLWIVGKKIAAEAEAWGGVKAIKGVHYRGMKPRPTTPGSYVVSGVGPYRTNSWDTSKIRWGTPLRVAPDGDHVLYQRSSFPEQWRRVDRAIPGVTLDDIRDYFFALWGDNKRYDSNGDGIPDVWVFNDFGPWAVRYFADPNRNRKLDGKEYELGEMIHTTPKTEANTDRNQPVPLDASHGCIHVRPLDRDRFRKIGAFNAGTLFVVHDTGEIVPEILVR
jgi:hypothetical protein